VEGEGVKSIAIGGAFFAWPYHAGVAAYLQANREPRDGGRIYGTSSGSVIAAMLACGIRIAGDGFENCLRADREGLAGRRTPFFRPRSFLAPHTAEMRRALPADAHHRANGRLFITIRRLPMFRQQVVSSFPTRDSLIDVLTAAIAFPLLTVPIVHLSPRFGPCVDGGPGVPDDDRAGATTTRVGVFQRDDYHIRPSTPLGIDQIFAVPPDVRRRELYALGFADAARHFEGRR
jgi:hypothetical protein